MVELRTSVVNGKMFAYISKEKNHHFHFVSKECTFLCLSPKIQSSLLRYYDSDTIIPTINPEKLWHDILCPLCGKINRYLEICDIYLTPELNLIIKEDAKQLST